MFADGIFYFSTDVDTLMLGSKPLSLLLGEGAFISRRGQRPCDSFVGREGSVSTPASTWEGGSLVSVGRRHPTQSGGDGDEKTVLPEHFAK